MKSKEMQAADVGKYHSDIQDARTLIDSTRVDLLRTYWQVGRTAAEACGTCGHDGHPQVIGDVAGDLRLAPETVACCLKIYQAYPTQEALEKVAEKGLSASHLKALVQAVADPETRERLEDKVQKHRFGVEELNKMVKREMAALKKQGKMETPIPIGVFMDLERWARKLCMKLRRDLEYAVSALDRMQVGEDKAETAGAKRNAFDELQKLGKELIFFAKRVPGLKWWEVPAPSKTGTENGGQRT